MDDGDLFPHLPPLDSETLAILARLKKDLEDGPKHLPEWADDQGTRGATPNEIVRSALFTARNRNQPRAYFRDDPIIVTGGGSISYRGEELRQDDELVWFRLLQLAKDRPLGVPIYFTPYSFLKSIGWDVNKRGYHHLRSCLSRMQATAIHLTSKRLGKTVVVSLVECFFYWDVERNSPLAEWGTRLSRELSKLFADREYTLVDLCQRRALPEGIATKLHTFLSSHRKPYPTKVETLQRLCGSTNDLRFFRRELKKALDALVRVEFLECWKIENGLVRFVRKS